MVQCLVLDLADVAGEEGLGVVGLAELSVLLHRGHVAELLLADAASPDASVLNFETNVSKRC
jgi:hypothetical protein